MITAHTCMRNLMSVNERTNKKKLFVNPQVVNICRLVILARIMHYIPVLIFLVETVTEYAMVPGREEGFPCSTSF